MILTYLLNLLLESTCFPRRQVKDTSTSLPESCQRLPDTVHLGTQQNAQSSEPPLEDVNLHQHHREDKIVRIVKFAMEKVLDPKHQFVG